MEEIQDELERAGEEAPEKGDGFERSLVRYREATKLFAEAAADAASVSDPKRDSNGISAATPGTSSWVPVCVWVTHG